jgi:hypothetical protein
VITDPLSGQEIARRALEEFKDWAEPETTSTNGNGQFASTVAMQSTDWLWEGRLPRGMLSGFDGDPERGKSQHMCLWAAHITRGKPWPDGSPCPVGNVILVGAEDSWSRTVVPRLTAAGADLGRVRLLSTVGADNRLLSIPEDVSLLEHLILQDQAVQICFDPLSAFLSETINANSEKDVRRVLTVFAEMLERTNCNAVAARHLNKNDKVGNALYRGLGSIGFNAVARTVLGVSKDPENGGFIFSVIKNNLAKKPRSQRYTIEGVEVPGPNDIVIPTARILWGDETDQNADELMIAFGKPPPRVEAATFLQEFLAGGPVESQAIFEAATAKGITRATLFRAKDELGVKASKTGYQGAWSWALPSEYLRPDASKESKILTSPRVSLDSEYEKGKGAHHTLLSTFDLESPKILNRQGARARTRVGCPECGTLAYSAGSLPGWRRCHKCGHDYEVEG